MENYENLSREKKLALLILPAVLISVLFIMFLILPLFEDQSKLVSEVSKQRNEIALSTAKAEQLPRLMQENERLKRELSVLEVQLPEEREVSGLLKRVSGQAIKSRLDITLWKPSGKTVHSSKEVYEVPVSVEMRGSYHKLGEFFSNVSALDRIVNFNNISMKHAGKAARKGAPLTITMTALTYSAIPPDEKKALEKAEKADKGKGK